MPSVGVVDDDRLLARGPRVPAVGERSQGVAGRRFGEDDLGAEVGEDPTGHRGGLAGEVDHPDPVQQAFSGMFVLHDGLHCS